MSIDNRSWSHPVRVTPDRGARTSTGTTENTLGSFVIALPLLLALQPLRPWLIVIVDQVRLDRFVLVKKLVHIHYEIFDHREAQHRFYRHFHTHVADKHFSC